MVATFIASRGARSIVTARAGCARKASHQLSNRALRSPTDITITDPLQQVIIYLNPKNKTATIFHFGDVGPTLLLTTAKQSKPKEKSNIRVGGQPGVGSGPADTHRRAACAERTGKRAFNPSIPAPDCRFPRMDATTFSQQRGATIVPLGTKNIEGVSATGTQNHADHQSRYNGQ